MPTEKKVQQVEELKQRISACTIAVATDYRGLSVNNMTELRRRLREKGIEYKVVKNNLARIAAEQVGSAEFHRLLEGTTAVAFGYDDPMEPARVLNEYVRTTRLPLSIRAGIMDGKYLSGSQLSLLLTLPSREELVAQLLGQMKVPLTGLVSVLNAPLVQVVNVLNAPLRGLINVLQQRIVQQQS